MQKIGCSIIFIVCLGACSCECLRVDCNDRKTFTVHLSDTSSVLKSFDTFQVLAWKSLVKDGPFTQKWLEVTRNNTKPEYEFPIEITQGTIGYIFEYDANTHDTLQLYTRTFEGQCCPDFTELGFALFRGDTIRTNTSDNTLILSR